MNRMPVGWAPSYVGQGPYYYPLTGPAPAPGGPSPGATPVPGGGPPISPVPPSGESVLSTAVAVAAFGLVGALLGWAVKPRFALAGAALGAGTRLATGPLVNPHVALPEPLQGL